MDRGLSRRRSRPRRGHAAPQSGVRLARGALAFHRRLAGHRLSARGDARLVSRPPRFAADQPRRARDPRGAAVHRRDFLLGLAAPFG